METIVNGLPDPLWIGHASCDVWGCHEPSVGIDGVRYLCAEHFDQTADGASQDTQALSGLPQ
jgi:hypothetical protein